MKFKQRRITSNSITNRDKRGFPLIRFVFFGILSFFVIKYFVGHHSVDLGKYQTAAVLPDFEACKDQGQRILDQVIESQNRHLDHVVKSGETFSGILTDLEISSETSTTILQSLQPLGIPTLFPGDSFSVQKTENGMVCSLDLFSRMQYKYSIQNKDSVIKAKKEELQVVTYLCLVKGALETSLSEAMQKWGVSDAIAANLADIFAWDINFFIDPRIGDTFQILFEKKYTNGKFVCYGRIIAAQYTNRGKMFSAYSLSDSSGRAVYYDSEGKSVQKQFLKAPLRYSRISSEFTFKRKHPILGIVRPHLGIDYAAPTGTPVCAAADGKVISAGVNGGFGNLVVLSHGGVYTTFYGHLNRFGKGIRCGVWVKQGDVIGTVGATGLATGPHLDYRMKKGSGFVNPATISLPSTRAVSETRKEEFARNRSHYANFLNNRAIEKDGCYVLEIKNEMRKEAQVNSMLKMVPTL